MRDYQPTKTVLVWACAGTAALTMLIGFTWGGWVTGGTAETRVAEASEIAKAELAAIICVEDYMNAPDLRARHAALMEESSWGRDGMIEDAGWATVGDLEEPVDGAADLCAERLAEAEIPPAAGLAATDDVDATAAN